jgi:hypothetical protein
MTMESNNSKESLQEHNGHMKEFRISHTGVALVNAPRYGESDVLARTQPLQISQTLTDSGGSILLNGKAHWSALVPIIKVAQYKLSQN